MDGSKGSNEWFQRVMAYCDNGNQTVTVTACKTTYSWIISKKIELNCCCKDIICEVFNGFSFIIIHRTPYIFIRTTYEYRLSCTRNVFLDQTSVHILYTFVRGRGSFKLSSSLYQFVLFLKGCVLFGIPLFDWLFLLALGIPDDKNELKAITSMLDFFIW